MKWPPGRMFSVAPGIRSASRCGQLGLTSWSSVPVQTSTGTTRSSGSLRRTPHHTEALTRQPRNVLRHSGIHPIYHRKFVVHARIRKRQRARDDRHSCHSMPQRVTDSCGVLAAHRPAHDGEPVDVELVEQFPDIARPVQDRAIGQRIGQPDAWPIGRDEPYSSLTRCRCGRFDVQATRQAAVRVDHRESNRVPVLRVPDSPSVPQPGDVIARGWLHPTIISRARGARPRISNR